LAPRIWQVGSLCRAVADALDARFNPVAVRGELSGCSLASSGHLYFSLKDPQGQIRCAMFRRAAGQLDFAPRDGELVEVWGRLGVYEPRGDLQLVVERMTRAGQGALFERFVRLKAKLEAEGLFDEGRKRELKPLPCGIGLVTSRGAAALHDVVTALRRRACHVPVYFAPASVQGPGSSAELVAALESLYELASSGHIDVILLVRGGGSIEDLWSFNDEQLARTIVRSPVPLICGVGHETDFTIADFCADVRAPTPTAAAELAARSRADYLQELSAYANALQGAVHRRTDTAAQRLDGAASRLGRPMARTAQERLRLERVSQRVRAAVSTRIHRESAAFTGLQQSLQRGTQRILERRGDAVERLQLRLQMLDPRLVLKRGYALLSDASGHPVTSVAAAHPGQSLTATLADGEIPVTVGTAANVRP
jgi:exodeoxyribonuclease VII large subunit